MLLEVAQRPLDGPAFEGAHHTLAEELLTPSVIYAPAILALQRAVAVRGVCHVTGGGLGGNLTRVLPKGVDAAIDPGTWEEPRIFGEIRRAGGIDQDEMRKVFNLGIGMVVIVPADEAYRAIDLLRTKGQRAVEIGRVEQRHTYVAHAHGQLRNHCHGSSILANSSTVISSVAAGPCTVGSSTAGRNLPPPSPRPTERA